MLLDNGVTSEAITPANVKLSDQAATPSNIRLPNLSAYNKTIKSESALFSQSSDTIKGLATTLAPGTLSLGEMGLPDGSRTIVVTRINEEGQGIDGQVEFFDYDGALQHSLPFAQIETITPCFTLGTLIKTRRGEVPVEQLRPDDRVLTIDNGYQRVEWVGAKHLSQTQLELNRDLRPIHISKGALGNGLPERDMMVSPQHRMLLSSAEAAIWFGAYEVLVAACDLTILDGVNVADVPDVTYVHTMCKAHEIICADGAWTESFQPNDLILEGHDTEIRKELLAIFPDLNCETLEQRYASARPSLKRFEARVMLRNRV